MASSDVNALAEPAAVAGARVGRYRWRICALLFAATTLNYVDRQVLGAGTKGEFVLLRRDAINLFRDQGLDRVAIGDDRDAEDRQVVEDPVT